jgi:hypothetical protein
MKWFICLAATVLVLSGCATTAPSARVESGTLYRGEVWTWDERTNIVTLRMGTQNVRVRTSPETIKFLRLHDITTIRGEIAPPEEIATVVTAPRPMRPVPHGSAQASEVSGTVSAVDPRGLVSIDSANGRITVWTATADTTGFPIGTPVRLTTIVQPVSWVPMTDGQAAEVQPAASVAAGAGEHAIVTGRVVAASPNGLVTVESPRGPIVVVTPNAASMPAGASVQVRTSLQRTR